MYAKQPKYGSGERFRRLKEKLRHQGYSEKSSKAIAASAGIRAHGKESMMRVAHAGKMKHHK